jgi:hypothetical protein
MNERMEETMVAPGHAESSNWWCLLTSRNALVELPSQQLEP